MELNVVGRQFLAIRVGLFKDDLFFRARRVDQDKVITVTLVFRFRKWQRGPNRPALPLPLGHGNGDGGA